MANLETLELTISANSQGAVQGIDKLTHSLVALGIAIQMPLKQLTLLNQQLRTLRSFAGVKLPNMGGGSNGKYRQAGSPVSQDEAFRMINQASQRDLMMQKAQGMVQQYVQNATSGTLNQKELADGALAIQKITRQIEGMGQASDQTKEKTSSLAKSLGTVSRIFKTMLIRTAIRSLIKGFTEAWQAAYEFSKSIGGEFATNIDTIKSSLHGAAISIISAFAPLMNVIVPIVNVLATGIRYLCDAIRELLALVGLVGESFEGMANSAGSAGSSASKAAKNSLAAFDELNVISSESGGGGGGGGGSSPFASAISEELATIMAAVAEATIAIGLILAFTGHVGIGVGLIAVGAAALVGTVIEKWGTLPPKVQGEVATIMAIVGGAMLAIGSILAFTGVNVGLGVALMAVGVANMVGAAALSWNLDDDIKREIGNVLGIIGTGMLAIGAVLAFSGANIPLGIGMMIAGGISLASAVALNWDSLTGSLQNAFGGAVKWLKEKWAEVKKSVGEAWDAVKKWWETSGLGEAVRGAWNSVSSFFSGLWSDIGTAAIGAWNTAKKWWETNVTKNVEKNGVWGGVQGFFEGVWNSVGDVISTAWDKYMKWTGVKWSDLSSAWESIKQGLVQRWQTVSSTVQIAWSKFSQWVNARWSDMSTTWEGIKQGLVGKWDNVKSSVTQAWDKVKTWISAKWSDMSTTWETIRQNMSGKWDNIKSSVSNAWTQVKDWVNATWNGTFKSAWGTIQKEFQGIWGAIKGSVGGAWSEVSKWWDTTKNGMVEKVKEAWKGLKKWFKENVTDPISDAWEGLKQTVKDIINFVIKGLNKLGKFTIPKFEIKVPIINQKVKLWDDINVKLWEIPELKADGGLVDRGNLFIAGEQGPELVGTMGGHTAVANNDQIVAGIAEGVRDANAEQNALLRRQNDILLGILSKTGSMQFGASSAFGRVVSQSLEMYDMMTGG